MTALYFENPDVGTPSSRVRALRSNTDLWLAENGHRVINRQTSHNVTKSKVPRGSESLEKSAPTWRWVTAGNSCPGSTTSTCWWRRSTCWSPGSGPCSTRCSSLWPAWPCTPATSSCRSTSWRSCTTSRSSSDTTPTPAAPRPSLASCLSSACLSLLGSRWGSSHLLFQSSFNIPGQICGGIVGRTVSPSLVWTVMDFGGRVCLESSAPLHFLRMCCVSGRLVVLSDWTILFLFHWHWCVLRVLFTSSEPQWLMEKIFFLLFTFFLEPKMIIRAAADCFVPFLNLHILTHTL